jgi:hypothetical protein
MTDQTQKEINVKKIQHELKHYIIRNTQLKQDLANALLELEEYKALSMQQKGSLDSLSSELGKIKRKVRRMENKK